MELGEKIKELRLKRRWTQEGLANELGVSAQTVSKWENQIIMPDITLLPVLSELFGITIDELFNLSVEQKLKRIENKFEITDELTDNEFQDALDYLKIQKEDPIYNYQATYLLAYLYTHRLMGDAKKVKKYAQEAIKLDPTKKDTQWMLSKACNYYSWDWNMNNHIDAIDFYKEVVNKNKDIILPYYYLIDNLIIDHRTDEAEYYLKEFEKLKPDYKVMIYSYKASIALGRYNEKEADEIIKKLEEECSGDSSCYFEIGQYYAKKGEYQKCIPYYEKSFELTTRKPRYIDELLSIRDIYNILGDINNQIKTYDRIIECLKVEWKSSDEDVDLKEMIKKRDELLRKMK